MQEHMKGRAASGMRKEETPTPEVDKNLVKIYRDYRLLRQGIMAWQAANPANSAAWTLRVRSERPAGADQTDEAREGRIRPYFTLTDLPEEPVLELWQLLNACSGISCETRSLEELLVQFKETGILPNDSLLVRLHFAFSGVAALTRSSFSAQELETANVGWASSLCPVCGENSRLALLRPPVGKRFLTCRVCGHEWSAKRVGCILCGSEDAKAQTYLCSDAYPGVEMVVCLACGETFKELDLREGSKEDFVWEDMRTLPLNSAADQWLAVKKQEKGKLQ